jgi:hypothetical protein
VRPNGFLLVTNDGSSCARKPVGVSLRKLANSSRLEPVEGSETSNHGTNSMLSSIRCIDSGFNRCGDGVNATGLLASE